MYCWKRVLTAHERAVLEEVTAARASALSEHGSPEQQAQAEAPLVAALRHLLAVVENYPELKASSHFLKLQDELSNTEDRIQAARRFYNANVRDSVVVRVSAIVDPPGTVVLSPDTGPLHMAVALDTPVIGLMGYNNPKRIGPYRKFLDLMVDAYGDPGEDYPISPAHREDRMPRIQVSDVIDRVRLWRERYR